MNFRSGFPFFLPFFNEEGGSDENKRHLSPTAHMSFR